MRRATLRTALTAPAAALAAALALAGCAAPPPAEAQADELNGTLVVLAAASLSDAFDEVAAVFEDAHPAVNVIVSYGGSASLVEQVRTGGIPADVIATASEDTMARLTDEGLVGQPADFASNVLVLAVPRGNPARVTGLADLAREELTIALCDEVVPCGAAAHELLTRAGVEAQPDTLTTDVTGVLTRLVLGEADAGLIYVTDAIAAGDALEVVTVPDAAEVITEYLIAALSESTNPDAASAFIDFVLSPDGQVILRTAGFSGP